MRITEIIRPGLPYLDNWRVAAFTAAVNLFCLFIFQYGREITLETALIDAMNAGIITSFINVFYSEWMIKRLRRAGGLPANVPVIGRMSLLPRRPLLLSFVFAAVFGVLTPLFNLLVIKFYGIETFTFARFGVWKVAYACALSAVILEWAALRYVQPDCSDGAASPQSGTQEVKNPLHRISALMGVYNSAVDDFGFNMIFGLLLGGTVVRGGEIVIPPTTRAGIVISGVVLGIIVTFRMAYPIAKSILALRRGGTLPVMPTADRRVAWLPCKPMKFALALMLPITALSAVTFWAVLTFFGFEELNFFQFYFIRVIFISLLSKCVVRLAIARYMQPE